MNGRDDGGALRGAASFGELVSPDSSVVPIEVGDEYGQVDVLVSVPSGSGLPTAGRLYVNTSQSGSDLEFEERAGVYIPRQMFNGDLGSLSVADFDNDGDEDFFVAGRGTQRSKLFRNLGGSEFENVTDIFFQNLLASGLLDLVACVTWIDYDHDNHLDLYLGRTDPTEQIADALLRFDPLLGQFDNVSVTSGLAGGPGTVTTAAWADFDGDYRWEVVKGSGFASGSLAMFAETDDGSFEPVPGAFPGELPTDLVAGLRWADLDRDNDLDLVVIRSNLSNQYELASSYVCYNTGGSLDQAEVLLSLQPGLRYACPFDYNLDGLTDILVAPWANRPPFLLANMHGLGGVAPVFTDIGAAAGLGNAANTTGALAADLNADGDLDLFLGRPNEAAGTVYHSAQPDGTELPQNDWVGLRLSTEGEGGQHVGTVLGSTVTLERSGQPLGVQVVDGGSGYGQQQSRDLLFGVGDLQTPLVPPLIATVRWPFGQTTQYEINQLRTVVDLPAPQALTIAPATVHFRIDVHPDPDNPLIDWVFTWRTNLPTPLMEDKVILHRTGGPCGFDDMTLQHDPQAGIDSKVTYIVEGGDPCYEHQLVWKLQQCHVGCRCTFAVESGLGGGTLPVRVQHPVPIRFSACPNS